MMIFIQLLGVVAFIFLFASYFFKTKENIVLMQLMSYMIFSIHYLFLGAFTGSLLELSLFLSSIVSNRKTKNKLKYLILFSIIYLVIALSTFTTWYSLIPSVVSVICTFSHLYGNKLMIKISGLLNCIGWSIYSIKVNSYPGIYINIILFIFIIISMLIGDKSEK